MKKTAALLSLLTLILFLSGCNGKTVNFDFPFEVGEVRSIEMYHFAGAPVSAEKKIILNGGTSWKEELREVIAEGIKRSKTPEAFKEYLNKCYGVKITRDGKDYSYLHPNKKQSEGRGSEHIIRKAR